MPIVAAVVLLGCIALTVLILRRRQGRREIEYEPELEEALERVRALVRRPAVVITAAVIVGFALIAVLARNPNRWAVLLLALAVLVAGVTAFLVSERRGRDPR